MKRVITDRNCYESAVKSLRAHLSNRPATKQEVAAQIESLKKEKAACLAWAETMAKISTDKDGNTWGGDIQGSMEKKASAGRIQAQIESLQAIADSPLHAYNLTTITLSERVAFYAKKAGIQ